MDKGSEVQEFRLDPFDTYTYLIIGALALLATLAMFFLHLVKRELRKQPGDLISMIAFSEFWLALHWFISAIRTDYITSDYKDGSFFCDFNSFIAVNAASLEITYNLCLITYVFLSVRSAIRKSYIPKTTFHVICWTVTVVQFFINQKKMYKRNPYGTCSVNMGSRDLYVGAGVIFISTIYAAFVYVYTNRKLPNKGAEMKMFRANFINYYSKFLQVLIISWIIVFLSFTAQILSNQKGRWEETLFAMGRLGNTVKVLMPVILFFIRMEDPKIQKFFYNYYTEVYNDMTQIIALDCNTRLQTIKADEQSVSPTSSDNLNSSIMDNNLKGSLGKGPSEGSTEGTELTDNIIDEEEPQNWLNQLPAKMKEAFTRTFVAAVSVLYYQTLKKKIDVESAKSDPNPKEIIKFELEGQTLMSHCKTEKAIYDCTLTIYFPEVFYSIFSEGVQPKDFKESFNIHYNDETIKKSGESGGGASGELFMFSKDNKFILKTITETEHKVFKSMILQYSEHLREHRDSLIGKIYGLFSFNFKMGEKPIRMIVMENLFSINKDAILRKYDLKGSRHSRKVLHKYNDIDINSKVPEILKDIDFENIEKEIKLCSEHHLDAPICNIDKNKKTFAAERLLERIEADVDFFKGQEIIDYSMILAVVDPTLCDTGLLTFNLQNNSHHWLESEDKKFIYIVGLIDYFQLYTFKKKAERFFKKVRQCDSDLETSSQPPYRYGIRFLEFIRKFFK